MSFTYKDFEDGASAWSAPPASKWDDCSNAESVEEQVSTAGAADDAVESLVEDAATRAIMSQMHMIRLAEPAVRVGLRALPDSKSKKMALEVFEKWGELEKENNRASPPNMLHFAYMSLIMARCIVLILDKLVSDGLSTTANMAVNVIANRLKSAVA